MGSGSSSTKYKKGKGAVQEEEDTILNHQVSGDIDHIDENRISKAGLDILQDFVESCDVLSTEEKVAAIRAKYEELLVTHPVPIRFMKFSDFLAHGTIPKFPSVDITCNLNSINRDECLLVFVSQSECKHGSVDDTYKLCVNGIRKLWTKFAPAVKECYLWIDRSCLDPTKGAQDLGPLTSIIKQCDVIFTPIPDADPHWNYGVSEDCLQNYQAKVWKDGSTSYLSSGRCRLEMLYGACLPTVGNENNERHLLFTYELAFHCKTNRRLHVLYGTKEDASPNGQLFVLNALNQHSFLESYNPEEGECPSEADRDRITVLMDKLRPLIHEEGYFGERNKQGQYHGRGVEWYANGDCYRGEFNKGLKEGQGVLISTHWVYEGQWKADKMNDTTCMITQSNGTVYEGEVRDGVWHGDGYLALPNGDTYEGAFEEGVMSGHGEYRHSNGDVYQGEFRNNLRDGTGTLTFAADGKVYEGEFHEGSFLHGAVRLPNGDVYEGDMENDLFHGTGKLHFHASGEIYEGEFYRNEMCGKGIFVYPRKDSKFDIYVGTVEKGIRNGVGTFTKADGSVEKGLWVAGNLALNLEKKEEE